MTIKESDFILTSDSDSNVTFDLELLKTINPRNGETREEFQNVAYGISMEYALKLIAMYRVRKNFETLSLNSFLSEYKKTVESLINLCKEHYL